MSKIWREIADPNVHIDFMSSSNLGGIPVEASGNNLIKKWVYFANVCNFTFQFSSLEQVLECREYFSKKIHPSTRKQGHYWEHYWHPWYSKLPRGINKERNRLKVIKALDEIIVQWGSS